jgi:hypothetical protein
MADQIMTVNKERLTGRMRLLSVDENTRFSSVNPVSLPCFYTSNKKGSWSAYLGSSGLQSN